MDPSDLNNENNTSNLKSDPTQNTKNESEGEENFTYVSEETINIWEV